MTDNNESIKQYAKDLQEQADNYKKSIEYQRFKQDCRKKSLDFGLEICNRSGNTLTSKSLTEESEKIYQWLITVSDLTI